MARDDTLAALSSVRLFAGFNRRELSTLAKASAVRAVPAGETIVAAGDTSRELYVVLQGEAVVRRNGRKVASLGPSDYFGELSLLDGAARSATVTAGTDTTVAVIGDREFGIALDEIPALGRKLLVGLAGRLREADARAYAS